jgi:hypothetical protein
MNNGTSQKTCQLPTNTSTSFRVKSRDEISLDRGRHFISVRVHFEGDAKRGKRKKRIKEKNSFHPPFPPFFSFSS